VRHVVDEHRARTTFRAVAPELGSRQAELVAKRVRQRFLAHHIDAPVLTVDRQRDEALDAPWHGRPLTQERCRAEQVPRRGGDRARGNDPLDEIAP
jgi:hypothetical protein